MIEIVKVKRFIVSILNYIPEDYRLHQGDEQNTFLYRLLNGMKEGNFDFYDQAKKLFLRGMTNPRNLRVLFEFPKDNTGLPAYVIREPGADPGAANSIGKMNGQIYDGGAWQIRDSRFHNFEIMCLSDNMLESIIMSEVLYALIMGSYNWLSTQYDLVEVRITELMTNQNVLPIPIFIKSVRLDLTLDQIVGTLVNEELLNKIAFEDAGIAAEKWGADNYSRDYELPGVESDIDKIVTK